MTYKDHIKSSLDDMDKFVAHARKALEEGDVMSVGMYFGKIEVTIARVPNTTAEMLDEEMPANAPYKAFQSHPSTIARGGVRR